MDCMAHNMQVLTKQAVCRHLLCKDRGVSSKPLADSILFEQMYRFLWSLKALRGSLTRADEPPSLM